MSIEKFLPQTKRIKYDVNVDHNEEEEKSGLEAKCLQHSPLLTLSDDVLLIVMGQLDSRDLINLSHTCERLNGVVRDRTLWSGVDLRNRHMLLCQLKELIEYLHPTTKFIASRGCLRLICASSRFSQGCSPSQVLKDIGETCPNLETFILEEHYFDAQKVSLMDFPSTTTNLSLKACEIYFLPRNKSFFHGISNHMANLEVLILDECQWLTPHSFLAISKCPNLRELRLKSCRNLGECIVYISVAARFGFKALEILDVRETSLADNEICCLNRIDSLSHLLVECPPKKTQNDVKNGQDASGHQGTGHQLPADICCTCVRKVVASDNDEPSTSHQSKISQSPAVVLVNLEEGTVKNFDVGDKDLDLLMKDDLPVYLDTETLITDRCIMSLGTSDIPKDPMAQVENYPFIGAPYEPPRKTNPNLSHLVINNCKGVTDKSLYYLSGMATLKSLNVIGTSVTASGIQQFQSHRPDVKLDYDFLP